MVAEREKERLGVLYDDEYYASQTQYPGVEALSSNHTSIFNIQFIYRFYFRIRTSMKIN